PWRSLSEEKPFQCQEHGKNFTSRFTLREHLCVHTGEKLYKYEEYGRSFTSRSNLSKHLHVHTGVKPYKC
ncbi:ZN708 protein, partial [Bucco capensis]|nr:ZN708 protein [Bucco capensis]